MASFASAWRRWRPRRKAWLAVFATVVITAIILRLEGRIWFCDCWQLRLWVGEPNSPHTSQHFLDPYSLTHLEHGIILFLALRWLAPRWSRDFRLWLAVAIEATWEIVENSPFVIERYRQATAALGYEGDSVWNALGDIVSCVAGYPLAEWLGIRASIALLCGIEVGLLFWIRDNLLLNVVMLFVPIESLKRWQLAA